MATINQLIILPLCKGLNWGDGGGRVGGGGWRGLSFSVVYSTFDTNVSNVFAVTLLFGKSFQSLMMTEKTANYLYIVQHWVSLGNLFGVSTSNEWWDGMGVGLGGLGSAWNCQLCFWRTH